MSTIQIHRRELIQTLEGLKQRIAANEPGCVCEVFEDLGEPNRFLWIERWPTSEDADRAQASDRFRALLGAIKVLGTLESIRRVRQTATGGRDPGRNTHLINGA